MKKEFAMTTNVKRFSLAMQSILSAPEGVDRMALIYGDPGLGKTETALWWVNTQGSDAAFVRTKKLMTGRWMLEELVGELGEAPAWRTSDLFRQAVDALLGTNRVIIMDEVDYLTHDARIIETLRDIHDMTGTPVVFLGMDQADKKLKRYRHLWRRFSQVIKFDHLTEGDISAVLKQICEIAVADDVVGYIAGQNRVTVAQLYRWAQSIEATARAKGLSRVSAADLRRA